MNKILVVLSVAIGWSVLPSGVSFGQTSCEKDCEQLFNRGALREGVSVEECIKISCMDKKNSPEYKKMNLSEKDKKVLPEKKKAVLIYYVKPEDSVVWKKIPPPPEAKCECQIYTESGWECSTSQKADTPGLPSICGDFVRNMMIRRK